ncbi:AI-2E family transporter [Velocimicrobium porci]|uniref:AI-2E family transporter n=1 Tax=Velocimicrobium porci TaxID=2606634 RepID=A0A6L5Y013_9FIRM|nr:AI-2E family transporter [Velocimicrobium porci]MSS64456.1 AI-2E family transporter [Velocimicrobium porci]
MNLNKKNVNKIRGLILFAILLFVMAQNITSIFDFVMTIIGLIFPFILGACIAFILNVPMKAIETTLFRKNDSGKLVYKFKRPISLVLSILLVIGIVFIVLFIVLPELGQTFLSLSYSIPTFWEQSVVWLEDIFKQYPQISKQLTSIHFDWENIVKTTFSFLQTGAGNVLNSTFNVASSIVSGLTTFFIGFVFSLYILLQKEQLGRQFSMVLSAFFSEKVVKQINKICHLTYTTFSNFLSGQCIEAVILGFMFFVSMTILRFPYALLVGVLIAFTALIPIFGAFIGCTVGVFLIFMVSPIKALWFLILFFILQQIEGNLIYPHVVGGSVGLPSIWVLAAVTIGGSTFGIVGMLVFIPLTSVLYNLFREYVYNRLHARKLTFIENSNHNNTAK